MGYSEEETPLKGIKMTIKKDLSDIGYLLITPNPQKFRFEGVNYRRAGIQLIIGAAASQLAFTAAVLYGPAIISVVQETPKKLMKKLKKK